MLQVAVGMVCIAASIFALAYMAYEIFGDEDDAA